MDCIWLLYTDEDHQAIEIEFTKFELEAKPLNGSDCVDYVQINDGSSAFDPLIELLCGSQRKLKLRSSGPNMFVHLRTNFALQYGGFELSYRAINATCGGRIILNSSANQTNANEWKVITSPNYPGSYDTPIRCAWLFLMPWVDQVQLQIEQFNMNCSNHDYLQLSGDKQHQQPLRLCSDRYSLKGQRYVGTTGLWVTFHAAKFPGQSNVNTGFRLRYKLVECNQTYESDNGFVLSPNYPSAMRSKLFATCTFSIVAPSGHKLSVYFVEFMLGKTEVCNESQLEVSEGSAPSARRIGSFCGYTVPNPIFSSTNRLEFKVKTGSSYSLYHLTYTSSPIGDGCGGNITAPTGLFTSPLYPQPYNRDQQCIWNLYTLGAYHYKISVLQMDLTSTTADCGHNYLEMTDRNDTSQLNHVRRFCGNVSLALCFPPSANHKLLFQFHF